MLFFFFRLSACQDYRLDVEVWKVIFAFQRCWYESESGGASFWSGSKSLSVGEAYGKTKNKRGGAIFQNCQTKWKVSWLLSKFIPKKRVDLVWFYTTFNNTSVISWQSVLFLEETGGRGENHRPVVSHWQTLSHNVVHLPLIEIQTHITSVVIGTDCTSSCKSNYHTITATTAPLKKRGLWKTYIATNTMALLSHLLIWSSSYQTSSVIN